MASGDSDVAAQWHPTRNSVTPDAVALHSGKKAWWKCPAGHEWEATINSRTGSGRNGCPYCSGRNPVVGLSDLATTHPAIAAEWHPEKNARQPTAFKAHSSYRAWWRCSEGHEWATRVSKRVRGTGCPTCAGQIVEKGVTDLATTHPALATEWHPTRNETTPADVSAGSGYRAWWVCSAGHEWNTPVVGRTRVRTDSGSPSGCPYCAGQIVETGVTDLATTHPALASEWHPSKNQRAATDVSSGSDFRAWWRCNQGHEWEAAVKNRARQSRGIGRAARCPTCSNRQVAPGINDLATTHPALAGQWHPSRNQRPPTSVTARSSVRAWWQCPKGHEWDAPIGRRVRGPACPVCRGALLIPGQNDLATTDPTLAAEWHDSKNPRPASSVTRGMTYRAWWLCPSGHEWHAIVRQRSRGSGCHICANFAILPGVNDLATTHPELATEWHPTRNSKTTTEVGAGGIYRAWWQCPEGHEWDAIVVSRSNGVGCPSCAQYGFDASAPAVLYLLTHRSHDAFKVGITGASTSRLSRFAAGGWVVAATWAFEIGADARHAETRVLVWLRNEMRLSAYLDRASMPIGGQTETFPSAGLPTPLLMETIASLLDSTPAA